MSQRGRGGGDRGGGRGGGGGGARGGYDNSRGGYDGGGRGGHDGGGRGGYDGGGRGGHGGDRGGRGGFDGGRGGRGGGGGGDRGGGGRGGGGGGGRGGRKIPATVHLATNMYGLNEAEVEKAVEKIFRYDIQILGSAMIPQTPEGEPAPVVAPPTFSGTPKKISKNAVRGITLGMRDKFKVFIATDGVSTLYSLGDLEPLIKKYISSDPTAMVTEKLKNMSLEAGGKEPLVFNLDRNGKKYAVQIKRVNWDHSDRSEKAQMMQVVVQFSFFVDASESSKSIMLTNRSIFMNDRKTPFSDRSDLMLFTGIFQSFRYNAANKPMVNIDVAHFPALRSDISIHDYMSMQAGRNSLVDSLKNPDFVRFINDAIGGKLVRARYGNNVTYRLDRLDTTFTPQTAKFEMTEKKKQVEMSVLDYMQKIKKLTVKVQNQPLLIAKIPPKADAEEEEEGESSAKGKGKAKGKGGGGSSKNRTPTWLLPEFLEFSIGEKRKKDLTALERLTREEPPDRFNSIDKNVAEINNNSYWKNFGVKIYQKMEVDAKVLNPVELIYSKGVTMTPYDGTWNLDGLKLFETPSTQQKWAIVYPNMLYEQVNEFVANFVDLSRVSGYDITKEPEYTELQRGDPNEYVLALKSVAPENRKKGVAFYLIILPDKDAERYARIKSVSNTELGIVTQCVVLESRRPPPGKAAKTSDKSVLGNIVAGINPKLCFQNCIVSPERLSQTLGGRKLDGLIVFGLDVFHGNTQDENRPSVVALCAAINQHYTKYATALRIQSARKEIVEELDSMVAEVMQEYMARRKVPPKEIIFYRDGVGEGMYDLVKQDEIAQLMRVMGEICLQHKQEPPKLTFLVVQKRNHLRSLAKDTPRGNPWPGTLVDDKNVVDGGRPNFYLYSHKALAGTARPTHYQVLEDYNKLTIQQLAEFTYALAHLHQGCTKSVSLPAPVFYADRACGTAGTCYRLQVGNLSKELKNTLFMI